MGAAPVTVVVPTHQRPELMRRAVESVVAQDYAGEVEVVVVFDACEPFVPDVELPARRTLRVVANRRSRGLAGARNTGILEASHDLVAFLDDDDRWLPGKLTAQLPLFDRPERPVLVGSAAVFDDGEHQHERPVPFDLVTHEELLRDRMAGLHSSTFVLRRDALLGELGLVDEDLPGSYGEDYDLLLRSAAIAPIPVVNRPLVSVTWSQGSYFFGRWGAYAEGLEYLCAAHPGFRSDPKAEGRIAAQIAFARAAHGDRALARSWVRRSIRRDPTQVKAWLALALSLRLVSVTWLVGMVQRTGRGI